MEKAVGALFFSLIQFVTLVTNMVCMADRENCMHDFLSLRRAERSGKGTT